MIKNIPSHSAMTSKSPMYIYATEMVSSYYDKLNIKGRSILTIVGSGDQVINAYFFGAKSVVGFDINRNSFHIFNLKKAGILYLSYHEFVRFFGKKMNSGNLKYEVYKILRKNLPSATSNYFDVLYKQFKYDGGKLIKSDNFRQRSNVEADVTDINHYLANEENYLKTRDILRNNKIELIRLDINHIDRIKDRFDIINLSNVLNYLTANVGKNDLLDVLLGITRKVGKKLNKNGYFFYYSYSPKIYSSRARSIPPASQLFFVKKLEELNNFDLRFIKFKGIDSAAFDRINIFFKK